MRTTATAVLAVALLVAACGDTADTEAGEPASQAETTTAAPTTTVAPTTTAPPTTTTTVTEPEPAPAEIVPGEDADVDAIVIAYATAFDSVSEYAAKAPFIDDPAGLEETVTKYLSTGESMGGIGVAVTSVTIDGDQAAVTYDLLFNDNPTYPNQTGTAILTADGWKVPRDVFCSLMASARVGCPAD